MKEVEQTKIERAAQEALKVVAEAAMEATKTLATAASSAVDAIRSANMASSADHDLLIKLETKMDGLKDDIKGLSDGTSKQISDHEIRINSLEVEKTRTAVLLSIGIGLLGLLSSLLIYHLIGK